MEKSVFFPFEMSNKNHQNFCIFDPLPPNGEKFHGFFYFFKASLRVRLNTDHGSKMCADKKEGIIKVQVHVQFLIINYEAEALDS